MLYILMFDDGHTTLNRSITTGTSLMCLLSSCKTVWHYS